MKLPGEETSKTKMGNREVEERSQAHVFKKIIKFFSVEPLLMSNSWKCVVISWTWSNYEVVSMAWDKGVLVIPEFIHGMGDRDRDQFLNSCIYPA